jgi:ribosomal-protein-alanine N-acetyltransferase
LASFFQNRGATGPFLSNVPACPFICQNGSALRHESTSPDGFTLREATDGDIALLDLFPQAISFASDRFLVATSFEKIAGYLAWRRISDDECEVLQLVVLEEYRRRGIASALLQRLIIQECSSLFLEVRTSNTAARQLYEKIGFTKIGIRRDYYSYPTEDAIVLQFHPC